MFALDAVQFAYVGQATPWRFDLSVEPGDILAITGASGSGKSTLLDLAAGFLTPASGRVLFDGQDITNNPPEHRPIAILFQADNLFDHLSVARNLSLGLPNGLSQAEQKTRIASALEEVGLPRLETRRASQLSGGQKQRVALARTLLRNAPVLLLDEPFTALDEATAKAMRDLVRQMAKRQNWQIIMVSHDPDDVAALATHTLNLSENQLREV